MVLQPLHRRGRVQPRIRGPLDRRHEATTRLPTGQGPRVVADSNQHRSLLQLRTHVLNDDLADDFNRWYPGFTDCRHPFIDTPTSGNADATFTTSRQTITASPAPTTDGVEPRAWAWKI